MHRQIKLKHEELINTGLQIERPAGLLCIETSPSKTYFINFCNAFSVPTKEIYTYKWTTILRTILLPNT